MKKHPVRHFFTNIICGLVINKPRRKKLRVLLNSDIRAYKRFIRRDCNCKIRKIRTEIGYGAQNLIMIINDAWVYKFPLRRSDSNELALREKRIIDAFQKISPVHIPDVEILELNGDLVRKYEYINGLTFMQLKSDDILAHMDEWTDTMALFMYKMATSNPTAIRDLKPAIKKPTGDKMFGWCHGDICGNFLVNPDTMKIVAIIDWEDCFWGDFSTRFHSSLPHGNEFMKIVRQKYLSLCTTKGKK